jgi:hypothetical protein
MISRLPLRVFWDVMVCMTRWRPPMKSTTGEILREMRITCHGDFSWRSVCDSPDTFVVCRPAHQIETIKRT